MLINREELTENTLIEIESDTGNVPPLKKVLYFIQSHQDPEQICRLVSLIKKSSYHAQVIISHNFSSSYLDLSSLQQFSGIYLIKRDKSARRGDDSVFNMYLNTINWLWEQNFDFDWLICLSGQDYPTKPIAEIEDFLSRTEYDGFISYWDILSEESPLGKEAGRKRFFAQYLPLPEWSKWWLRKLSRIEPFIPLLKIQWRFALIGLEAKSTPFNDDFKCYGAWYWSTLSRKCIEFLRSYLEKYPGLLRYYNRTLAPEESLIATVLVNSQQFNLCNDCLRYLDYPPELFGYARNLTVDDYAQIISSNALFARKFDLQQDRKILDLLDEHLLHAQS